MRNALPAVTPLRQRGSSLVVSLVILTAITLGAMVAMQRSTLQVRMVGNMQHHQALFNAAYGDISNLLEGLRNAGTATTILNAMIQQENNSLAAGLDAGTTTLNPYRMGVLNAPPLNTGVSSTSNALRVLHLPTSTPHSLKMHSGSSTGTLVPYHFATNVVASSVNNGPESRQEAGFFYKAPAQQQ